MPKAKLVSSVWIQYHWHTFLCTYIQRLHAYNVYLAYHRSRYSQLFPANSSVHFFQQRILHQSGKLKVQKQSDVGWSPSLILGLPPTWLVSLPPWPVTSLPPNWSLANPVRPLLSATYFPTRPPATCPRSTFSTAHWLGSAALLHLIILIRYCPGPTQEV